MDFVTEPRWARIGVAASVGLLMMATMVWSSGEDMFFGLLLIVVLGGWGLLALYGIVSFVQAARERAPSWFRRWSLGSLGCLVAFVGSAGVGAAGVPEDVRIRVSRGALVDAGERVLAGEHPTRAGLYGLGHTSVSGDCALLETGSFMISSFGFAYCPNGTAAGHEHLGGGLYKYFFD